MKLSARNHFSGTVRSVELRRRDGRGHRGRRRPADRVGDHPLLRRAPRPGRGKPVTVFIKATEVMLGVDEA